MITSENMPLFLRTIFLTEPELLNLLPEMMTSISGQNKEFKERVRLCFTRRAPKIPEHQRKFILDEIFEPGSNHSDWLLNSFHSLARELFSWRDQELRFTRKATLLWVEMLSAELSTLPLMAYMVAEAVLSDAADLETIGKIFSGPIIPLPEDPFFEPMLNDGLTETHLHFNNSAHPAFIWDQILQSPRGWIKEVCPNANQMHLWNLYLPETPPHVLLTYLEIAGLIRGWVVSWCLNEDAPSPWMAAHWLTKSLRCPELHSDPPLPGIPMDKHPGEFLRGGRPGKPLVNEGAFWTHAFCRLRQYPDETLSLALHVYHLIMSLVHRVVLHQKNMKGFDLFDMLASSGLRKNMENHLHRERLVQLDRTGRLRGLEARIAGREDKTRFVMDKLRPLVMHFIDLNSENESFHAVRATSDAKCGPGDDQDVEKRGINCRLGVICHFIKQDEDRKEDEAGCQGTDFISGRHAKLRESLLHQAEAMLWAREYANQWGRYLVGVDGAGNELRTPPEVFAPVFRHLRHRLSRSLTYFPPEIRALQGHLVLPPLRFTYHVGEEFRHLLSGLRAIDEALEFLDMPPGSRLGHCTALGFDPKMWLERAGEVRLPRLEWLDNLVWLFHQDLYSRGFKTGLRDEINRHCLEVYGEDHGTDLLYQAWQFRKFGPTQLEQELPYQKKSSNDQKESFSEWKDNYKDAFDLFHRYHHNRQVWEKGNEIITIKQDQKKLDQWLEVLQGAQELLEKKVEEKQLAIEACPLSNIRISLLEKIKEHPIFRWHSPIPGEKSSKIYVLIATDNPGLFQNSLPLEYQAVSCAARQLAPELSNREILAWLKQINDDTEFFSFIPPIRNGN
ncbi:MAG: hypothetical protein HQK57_00445 [Deltaproteobacteria bacterium]|nr:hypothetical protein [Deltaproteobacteria bacterium]